MLLYLAIHLDWLLQQRDVKTVFLHGDLEEEVSMKVPPDFSSPSTERNVSRLRKALSGVEAVSSSLV